MKKIIILLLCCGVLIGMVGCGGNTAPPPTESQPTMVSEMVITETPTETTPPVAAVEPTEKEKEPSPTENTNQATKPTVTTTEPTITAKPKDEPKPTTSQKPTGLLAAENTDKNSCITISEDIRFGGGGRQSSDLSALYGRSGQDGNLYVYAAGRLRRQL